MRLMYKREMHFLRVRVTLQLKVGQSVRLGVKPLWDHVQIMAVVKTVAVLYIVGRPP
jgi:hypothetical protein